MVPSVYPTHEYLSVRIVWPAGRFEAQGMLEELNRGQCGLHYPSNAIDHRKTRIRRRWLGSPTSRCLGKRQSRLRSLCPRRGGNRRHSHGAKVRLRTRKTGRRAPPFPGPCIPTLPALRFLRRLPLPARNLRRATADQDGNPARKPPPPGQAGIGGSNSGPRVAPLELPKPHTSGFAARAWVRVGLSPDGLGTNSSRRNVPNQFAAAPESDDRSLDTRPQRASSGVAARG